METTAHLRVINGPGAGATLQLNKPQLVVGRHFECDISIDHLDVSRRHTQILRVGGEFFLEDLHSTNGTFLNDQPVHSRQKIAEGDRIRISDLIFEFHCSLSPPAPPTARPAPPQVSANEEVGVEKHTMPSRPPATFERIVDGPSIRQSSIETERDFADRLQQAILPSRAPDLSGYQFYQYYCSAAKTAGDFYDYAFMYDGRLMVFMADITGHGESAALLMVRLALEIRSSLLISSTPRDMLRNLNQALFRYLPQDHFVKLVAAELVPATGDLTMVNAGHRQPLLCSQDGKINQIGGGEAGLPLGVADDADYSEIRCVLPLAGTLILYSDGAEHATAPSGDVYGHERIRSQIAAAQGGPLDIGERLVADLRQFIGRAEQRDDICIVCLGRE